MGVGHGHGHAAGRAADRSRLRLVLLLTAVVLVVELLGAWLAGSLALLADAGHLATDATGLVAALGASYVAARPGGPRSTFGYHRAEILAAMANALVLLVVCGYLLYAGIDRLRHPGQVEIEPRLVVVFAAVGLVANLVSLRILRESETGSLNLKGAATEVFADAVGSVLALLAGVVIWWTGQVAADAVASLLIAALILPRSLMLLRDAAAVLLEIAPAGLDLEQIQQHLREMPGVLDVHDLHAWTITSGLPSLSAHVVVADEVLTRDGVGVVLDRLAACVAQDFEIRHATFQVEPGQHRDHEDLGDLHH